MGFIRQFIQVTAITLIVYLSSLIVVRALDWGDVSIYAYDEETKDYMFAYKDETMFKHLFNSDKAEVTNPTNISGMGEPEFKLTLTPSPKGSVKSYNNAYEVYYLEHLSEYIIIANDKVYIVTSWGDYKDLYKELKELS